MKPPRAVVRPAKLLAACCFFELCATNPAFAQNTLDRLLSQVDIKMAGQCSSIDISLNRPATYAGRFPKDSGSELTIRLDISGTSQTPDGAAPEKESASVKPGNSAGLVSVSYDPSGAGPVILLTFAHDVHFSSQPGFGPTPHRGDGGRHKHHLAMSQR